MAKSSPNSMKSSIRLTIRCATRSPVSASGKITWCAPTEARILACFSEVARAQICGTPSSASASTVSTLASTEAPMATTTRRKSATPSCRSAPSSVASAWTTRSSYADQRCTCAASRSMAEHLVVEPGQRPGQVAAEPAQPDHHDAAVVRRSLAVP